MPNTLSKQDFFVQLVKLLRPSTSRSKTQVSLLGLALNDRFGAVVVLCRSGHANFTSDLVGADKLLVLVDDGPTKTAFLDDDGGEDETGTNLDEVELGLRVLFACF
jgi:hypothetical protein